MVWCTRDAKTQNFLEMASNSHCFICILGESALLVMCINRPKSFDRSVRRCENVEIKCHVYPAHMTLCKG